MAVPSEKKNVGRARGGKHQLNEVMPDRVCAWSMPNGPSKTGGRFPNPDRVTRHSGADTSLEA